MTGDLLRFMELTIALKWQVKLSSRRFFRCLAAVASFSLSANAWAAIDPAQAKSIFDQAQAACSRDDGLLWGHTLCGPMLLVDPDDRSVVANQADKGEVLTRSGDVFVGILPPDVIISDTTVTWSGTRWCELMWPWPMREDTDYRHVMLAHESFHRIQSADLHIHQEEGDNRHLDTQDGRYLMEMEWRALAAALQATSPEVRRQAISDAVLFARQRYKLFPNSPANEAMLETSEGLAEYTGVRVGLVSNAEGIRYALRDLNAFDDSPSLIRSFGYAIGPAMGLLLDEADPNWRKKVLATQDAVPLIRFDQRLSAALQIPDPDFSQLQEREAVYDSNKTLYSHEVSRGEQRKALVERYRSILIDGPVLVLPLADYGYQFKPQSLVAIEQVGTVYPNITLTDAWGKIIVNSGGVLIRDNKQVATASAKGLDLTTLTGPSLKLTLKPGWTIVPGKRAGDLVVQRKSSLP